MQRQHKRCLVGVLVFSICVSWQAPLTAEPSAEALCEKLYSDLLNRAKQALVEEKHEEALRFLLEAATVTERCGSSPEPSRQRGPEENVLASAPSMGQASVRLS